MLGFGRKGSYLPKTGMGCVRAIHSVHPCRQEGRPMIVGLTLAGSVIGVVAALTALLMGQGIWMALLIYSGTGVLIVLAGAILVARLGTRPRFGRSADEAPAPGISSTICAKSRPKARIATHTCHAAMAIPRHTILEAT
ncbi:hypothetical protein ACROSR_18900 [Roseovarius tibetensis]|uniref:hypothetical protein n=1 Tax=Roseovarius tibetensis TaxID=2685897 RepID=UPI003D7F4C91